MQIMNATHLLPLLKARDLKMVDLARKLGVDKATVTRWCRGEVPPKRAIEIENAIAIPRYEIRPDLWSAPDSEEAR